MLLYSLIHPFPTYGTQVWGLTYPTYLIPVITLQKRVVRITTFSESRSHSEPLLKSLRLHKFSNVIHLEILSFVYHWYHKLSPSSFVIFLTQYLLVIHIIHINHRLIICLLHLFIPLKTAFVLSSLSYTGPKLWNYLSIVVKKIKPFSSFPQYIKNYVIDGYNTIIDP